MAVSIVCFMLDNWKAVTRSMWCNKVLHNSLRLNVEDEMIDWVSKVYEIVVRWHEARRSNGPNAWESGLASGLCRSGQLCSIIVTPNERMPSKR